VKLPDDKDYRLDGSARYKNDDARDRRVHPPVPIHVLPKGLHRIRHYGLLAKSNCAANLARASTERCLGSAAIVRVV
jgi:Putative transposase